MDIKQHQRGRPMRTAVRICAAAFAMLPGARLAAQTPDIIEVRNRPHPELDPIGLPVGSFRLYPKLELTGYYEDNVFGASYGRHSDVFGAARLSGRLISNWSRNSLTLQGHAEAYRFARFDSENSEAFGVSAMSELDISRTLLATLNGSYEQAAESRLDVNANQQAINPIIQRTLSLTAGLSQTFNRLTVSGDAQLYKLNYGNGVLGNGTVQSQDFRNSTSKTFTGRASYDFAGGASAIVNVIYDELSYDDVPGVFDRDSHGVRAEAGIGFPFSRILSGEVRVGYLTRHNDNPLLHNSNGLSFSANVLWNPTPLISARLLLNRAIEAGGSTVTAGNIRTEGTLLVDYELLRQLIVSASVRVAHVSAIGLLGASDELATSLGAIYRLNRRFQLNATFRHYHRTAGITLPLSANSLGVGAAVTF